MKKVSIIFSFFAGGALLVAAGLYRLYLYLYSDSLAAASKDFTDAAVAYFNPFMLPSLLFYVLGSLLTGISLIAAISLRNSAFIDAVIGDRRIYSFARGIMNSIVVRKIFELNIIPKAVLLLSAGFTFFLFSSQIFYTPNIMNAFLRIPEMYNINNADVKKELGNSEHYRADKTQLPNYVDTTSIINKYNLVEGYEYVDIFNYQSWKSNNACMAVQADNQRLSDFVARYTHDITRPEPGVFWERDSGFNFFPLLHYSEDRLCIIPGSASLDQDIAVHTYIRRELADLGVDSGALFLGNQRKPSKGMDFADEAIRNSYIKHSALEKTLVANGRGQLRHHIYYLFPSYEYLMGKPIEKIAVQYGVGHTFFLSAVAKVAQLFDFEPTYGGGVNFLSAFIYIGFAVFVCSLHLVFKDIRLTSLAALLPILVFLMRGYDSNFLGIGVQDLRVIFDLPAVYCLYRYHVTKRNGPLWWLMAFLLLGLLNNFEFGIFLATSMLGALFIYRIMEQTRSPNIVYFTTGILCIILAIYMQSLPMASVRQFFLLGFFSQHVGQSIIIGFILLFILYIFMFIHMRNNESALAYPFLAVTFYAQTTLCYYIFHGYSVFFYILLSRLTLPAFFYSAFLFKTRLRSEMAKNAAYGLIAVALIAFISTQYKHYKRYRSAFSKTFTHHKVYAWNKRGMNINSTMNPEFFEPAVELIEKYIPDRKDLYMISQYDFLLTYLAKKYSGMPHYDLSGNMINEETAGRIAEHVHRDKPEYIFMDSDINTPYELSIPYEPRDSRQYGDGLWHTLVLNQMRSVYEKIIGDYTLVEQGRLISVYRRDVTAAH